MSPAPKTLPIAIDDLPAHQCTAALALIAELRRHAGYRKFRMLGGPTVTTSEKWLLESIINLDDLGLVRTESDPSDAGYQITGVLWVGGTPQTNTIDDLPAARCTGAITLLKYLHREGDTTFYFKKSDTDRHIQIAINDLEKLGYVTAEHQDDDGEVFAIRVERGIK